jgi:pimeloyl-ACP methyl ester carboxylesterase
MTTSAQFPSLPHVAGVEHSLVRAGEIDMHVATAGSGPPLLMLHGWPEHWFMWRKLIPELARTHRVICPDLRGFGWSDAPPGAYDKETLADDVVALLDALGLDSVQLVGHDWGGWTGFLVCLGHPERVERFVALSILHPWPEARGVDKGVLVAAAYQLPIATPFVGQWALRAASWPIEQGLRAAGGDAFDDEAVASYAERMRQPERARATSALYRTFLTRELPQLREGRYDHLRLEVPTRLVLGADDAVVTPSALAGYEEHADDMVVEVIEGGHFLPEERPREVLAEIEAHLGAPAATV